MPRTMTAKGDANMPTVDTAAAAYVDAADVAAILGIAEKTVRNWASLRSGPPQYRFGGAARYSVSEVYEWAAAQRVGA